MKQNRCGTCPVIKRRDFLRLGTAGAAGAMLSRISSSDEASAAEAKPNKKPNILFLMTDQHRGDCLGCDGNSKIKTPNFDRIAREGVRFPHAYSSTPTCTPARSGILTGCSPWRHGMVGFGKVAQQYPVELPRMLKAAGYYTHAVGKLHYTPQHNFRFDSALIDESSRRHTPGFISDYHKWFEKVAPGQNPEATGIGWNDYLSGPYALPEHLHPTHWTGQNAVKFIEEYDRPEPFLLKVSFARPHSPYDPPERFWNMYKEEDMPGPSVGKWAEKHGKGDPSDHKIWRGDLGVEQAKRSRRGYYGSVSFIDEQVGLILSALEKRGMLENTLILFTSDHGDMLGDHHLWRKSYAYEGSARISMLMRWPKSMGMEDKRGTNLDQVVELRDVLPTFLDAAGASIPESIDGSSMLNLVRGRTEGWRKYIDLEHDVCYSEENNWNALTDGRWKYIYHAFDGREQLFDLKSDPGEVDDLAQDQSFASELGLWRQRMVEHLSERDERYVKDGKLMLRSKSIMYGPNYPRPEG